MDMHQLKPKRRRNTKELIELVKKLRLAQLQKNKLNSEICRLCSLLGLAHCDPGKFTEVMNRAWLKELQDECNFRNINYLTD